MQLDMGLLQMVLTWWFEAPLWMVSQMVSTTREVVGMRATVPVLLARAVESVCPVHCVKVVPVCRQYSQPQQV